MPRRVEQAALTSVQAQAVLAGWVGLALLFMGLVTWYATGVRAWYTTVLLVVAILSLADWAAFAAPLVMRRFSPRQLAAEANSTVFIVALVAITGLLNYVANRRHIEWDLTKGKRYSLSNYTKSILGKVKEKVEVTAFYPTRGTWANQRAQAQDLLKQYESASDNVRVKFVDPLFDRATATAKGIKTAPTILFETPGKRQEALTASEKEVTAAFLKLQSGQKKKIYFLQGHGELDPDEADQQNSVGNIKQELVDQQHEVAKLTLIGKTQSVPADAAVVVIAGPKGGLRTEESKAIQTYLNGGGHVLLLVGSKTAPMPDLLNPWGVKVGSDRVVDLQQTIQGSGTPIAISYETHEITKDLARQLSIYPSARSVTPITPAPTGVTVSALVKTSQNSWAETNIKGTPALDSKDTPGPITLAVAMTKDLSGPAPSGDKASGKTSKIARLVVIGSSDMAANDFTQSQLFYGNLSLLTGTINWLAEEEALVNIPPKEEGPQNITLTDPQKRTVAIFVYSLPLAAMLMGAIVWWKRR